jgi:hypothetical protein
MTRADSIPEIVQGVLGTSWFATVIAVLSLVLSTYSLYLQRRDARPRLRIQSKGEMRARVTVRDFVGDTQRTEPQPAVVCVVQNVGDRSLRFGSVYLRPLIGRRHQAAEVVGFGWGVRELNRDESREVQVFAREVLEAGSGLCRLLRAYRVEMDDHMGRRWRGKFVRLPRWPVEDAVSKV